MRRQWLVVLREVMEPLARRSALANSGASRLAVVASVELGRRWPARLRRSRWRQWSICELSSCSPRTVLPRSGQPVLSRRDSKKLLDLVRPFANYHRSDRNVNTPVIHLSDEIPRMENETIAARLLRLRKEAGLTQVQLAQKSKVTQGTIGNIESGSRGYGESIVDIASALKVTPEYLRGETSELPVPIISAPETQEGEDGLTIQQFRTGGAMGNGLLLQDQPGVIRSWSVSNQWVQENVHRITSVKNLAIVTGFGDSMRPLYNPGDPLLIDRGIARADTDGIYFFRVNDEGFVKRLQRIPTEGGTVIRAKSENPRYDPFDITKTMDFEVYGRVVKAWRGEEF